MGNKGWAKNIAIYLGALGTFLGAVGTIWAGWNSHHLSALQFQYQSDRQFSDGIQSAGSALIKHDIDPGDKRNDANALHAMVWFSSLYATAETVQQKLILVEMAQVAHQNDAVLSLSGLVRGDDAVQKPKSSEIEAAEEIKKQIYNTSNFAFAKASAESTPGSPSPSPTSKSTSTGEPLVAASPPFPAEDVALTESDNPTVRANAALIAALPAGQVSGWVFIGDASGKTQSDANAPLDPRTDAINVATVPSAPATVTACQDLNVRVKPFQGSGLGAVVGIAPRGSVVTVDKEDAISSNTISKFPPHNRITAKWIHVTLDQAASSQATGNC